VDVEHTFPVENRPLYDVTRGKMTYEHRDETLPKVAKALVRIAAAHPDEKGLVHCHSYAIQSELRKRLARFGLGGRVRAHDREDRDAALESWKATDDPDIFLSVKMEEALDLAGDLCRWQVICKAPYLNTNDSRVARRLEEGQWSWYHRTALRTVIQACGRVVRAPDDYGATYLADSSLLDLFDRTRGEMPPWFREQVDRLSVPDLPAFEAAADAASASRSGRTLGSSGSTSRTGRDSGGVGRGTGESAGPSGSTVDRGGSGGRGSDSDSNHPLSDVWGDG
jgi:Rad3-related DNA helicase